MEKSRFNPSILWQHGVQTLKGIWPDALYISFFCFLVPHAIFVFTFGRLALDSGRDLQTFIDQLGSRTPSILEVLAQLENFARILFMGWVILCICYLIGYRALLNLAQRQYMGLERLPVRDHLFVGCKRVFGVVAIFLLMSGILVIAAAIFPPLLLLLLPLMMAPAVHAIENSGLLRTLLLSASIGYADRIPGGRLSAFIHILSTGSIVYLSMMLLGQLDYAEPWMRTGLALRRNLGFLQPLGDGLSPAQLLTAMMHALGWSLILMFLASFTTSTYLLLRSINRAVGKTDIATQA